MTISSKRAAGRTVGRAARDILALLHGGIRLSTLSAGDEGVADLLSHLARANSTAERARLLRKLHFLKERGYLTKQGERYVTTRLANQLINEDKIWSLTLTKPKQWDGKWHMVLFDIPAKKQKQRRAFRFRLKELGLVLYQHSVWVYPYPLEKEVIAISDFYAISDFVLFATAETLAGEGQLKREFGLK